jgi:HNH endonuclease
MILDFTTANECFDPDFGQGTLTWRVRPLSHFVSDHAMRTWNTRYAGKLAFTTDGGCGYFRGSCFGKSYLLHRVLWLLHSGAWPAADLDHIDHDRRNNATNNLREVTRHENCKNVSQYKNTITGVTGVYIAQRLKKYQAQLNHNGKRVLNRRFFTLPEAEAALAAARLAHGFHINHGK